MFKKMYKKKKNKKLENPRGDSVDCFSRFIGGTGCFLALCSFLSSCHQEKRNQHWSCINDSKHYPIAYQITGKQVTENLFKWIVTPEVFRHKNLQQSIRIFLSQLEESRSDIKKHSCQIRSLDKMLTQLREIDSLVAKNQFNKINVDKYSETVKKLATENIFSEQCCPKPILVSTF